MTNDVINIRVFYTKMSRAKYISHLDITRCMQRAIKRARIPVWYTEGFNPHIYITFALPLSLGFESKCEIMDMRLVSQMSFDEVKEKLNLALPADIRVTNVALQKNKPDVIAKANYTITLSSETSPAEKLKVDFELFMQSEKIEVMKKSKKGMKAIDIKPDCSLIDIQTNNNSIVVNLDCTAGSIKNINPTLLISEFKNRYGYEDTFISVLKNNVYDVNGELFE